MALNVMDILSETFLCPWLLDDGSDEFCLGITVVGFFSSKGLLPRVALIDSSYERGVESKE